MGSRGHEGRVDVPTGNEPRPWRPETTVPLCPNKCGMGPTFHPVPTPLPLPHVTTVLVSRGPEVWSGVDVTTSVPAVVGGPTQYPFPVLDFVLKEYVVRVNISLGRWTSGFDPTV